MDGVIYKDNHLIPGADDFVHRLIANENKFLFLTNNSEATPKVLVDKLLRLGIKGLKEDNFITAAMATATFLETQAERKTAYLIGGPGIYEEMEKVGFSEDDENPEYVVVGKTKDFNFSMMKKAIELINKGSRFIATNPDILDPVENGFEPACGCILASIEKGAGLKPYIVGKPNALIMTIARKKLGVHPEDTIMLGDRMDTDIIGGMEAGMQTCLVLSGVSSRESIKMFPYKPDYIFDSVADIYPEKFE